MAFASSGPTSKVIPGTGKDPMIIDSKRKEKLLKSKKKLLKLKEKGTKLIFDEEGLPHQVYELEDEEAFKQRGPVEAQRAKFLEEEAARVREADQDDKQLAKIKNREKREKRKAREATKKEGMNENEVPGLVDTDDIDDPMALLASLPLADDEPQRPQKRLKKWFEDDSEDEKEKAKQGHRIIEAEDDLETLEDLEALAAGLLN